jgi:large subunit ribosomal protein L29
MSLPQFTDIISLSNVEISEAIIETETKLFQLRFKKATRQNLKSHQIKHTKRQLAQLKTLLRLRLESLEQTEQINK